MFLQSLFNLGTGRSERLRQVRPPSSVTPGLRLSNQPDAKMERRRRKKVNLVWDVQLLRWTEDTLGGCWVYAPGNAGC